MIEAEPDKKDQRDPVLEHFIELRKYIEHSHDGLSGGLKKVDTRLESVESRLETVETRLGTVETRIGAVEARLGKVESRLETMDTRLGTVETGQQRLETKLDSGFDRMGRKIDALMGGRRASARRRKP